MHETALIASKQGRWANVSTARGTKTPCTRDWPLLVVNTHGWGVWIWGQGPGHRRGNRNRLCRASRMS